MYMVQPCTQVKSAFIREQNCTPVFQSPVLMFLGKLISLCTMLPGENRPSCGTYGPHVACYVLFDRISFDQLHAGNGFVAFWQCTADFVALDFEDIDLPFVMSCGVGLALLV